MKQIQATGKVKGEAVKVEWFDDIGFLFNGEKDGGYETDILYELSQDRPIGGTYYPETEKLKIVAVLEGRFFDRHPETLEIYGDIEQIPHEEGVIY